MWPFWRFSVTALKPGLWSPEQPFARKSPAMRILLWKLLLVAAPSKIDCVGLIFFFLVLLLCYIPSSMNYGKPRHVYLNGFCWNVTLAFQHLFAFPYNLNKGSSVPTLGMENNILIFPFAREVWETKKINLACHFIHSVHLSWIHHSWSSWAHTSACRQSLGTRND